MHVCFWERVIVRMNPLTIMWGCEFVEDGLLFYYFTRIFTYIVALILYEIFDFRNFFSIHLHEPLQCLPDTFFFQFNGPCKAWATTSNTFHHSLSNTSSVQTFLSTVHVSFSAVFFHLVRSLSNDHFLCMMSVSTSFSAFRTRPDQIRDMNHQYTYRYNC